MPEAQFFGTDHFVWRREDRIGHGAFGSVFKGFNKENGDPVAIKAVHNSATQTLYQHEQELSILKQLNHPNVVRFIGVEETTDEAKQRILIMEYCEAGSLHDVLQEPANAFGLSDDHFLLVLKHLTEGLRHLRSHQFVHRDIKPSNVLRTYDANGEILYKLCDFGAARSLDDQQEFMSLVGTEEYLHPDIYKKAFFGGGTLGKKFHAYTDLWSLGVLVYQLATGDLPFRPFGGRKNKTTMHQMTVNKPDQAIAGIQREPNGKIYYYTDLPVFSALSRGIQAHISTILRGLLQIDPAKLWTYADAFAASDKVLRLRPIITVFDVRAATSLRVYLPSGFRMQTLLHELQKQLDPSRKSLLDTSVNGFLLWADGRLMTLAQVRTLPSAGAQSVDPSALCYLWTEMDAPISESSRLPANPRFPASSHILTRQINDGELAEAGAILADDRYAARECLAVTCWIQARIEERRAAERHLNTFVDLVRVNSSVVLSGLEKKLAICQTKWGTLQRILDYLDKMQSMLTTISSRANGKVNSGRFRESLVKKLQSARTIMDSIDAVDRDVKQLRNRFVGLTNVHCREDTGPGPGHLLKPDVVNEQVAEISEIISLFSRDLDLRINEKPNDYRNSFRWHDLQRKNLKRCFTSAVSILETNDRNWNELRQDVFEISSRHIASTMKATEALSQALDSTLDMVSASEVTTVETLSSFEAELQKLQADLASSNEHMSNGDHHRVTTSWNMDLVSMTNHERLISLLQDLRKLHLQVQLPSAVDSAVDNEIPEGETDPASTRI